VTRLTRRPRPRFIVKCGAAQHIDCCQMPRRELVCSSPRCDCRPQGIVLCALSRSNVQHSAGARRGETIIPGRQCESECYARVLHGVRLGGPRARSKDRGHFTLPLGPCIPALLPPTAPGLPVSALLLHAAPPRGAGVTAHRPVEASSACAVRALLHILCLARRAVTRQPQSGDSTARPFGVRRIASWMRGNLSSADGRSRCICMCFPASYHQLV